jgi:hypothetical protein
MTERNPALWLQNRTDHTAEQDRALLTSLFGNREGVLESGHLAVTQNSAGADMSVDVAAGFAIIKGDDNVNQGLYHVWNDDTVNVAIAASDGTNPRKDLVVARVQDAFYTGATNAFAIEVLTGAAAASPTEPSVPNNCIVLALVDVAAGALSITDANITDRRFSTSGQARAAAVGGKLACLSTNRPSSPFAGLEIYETDTGKSHIYTGSAWLETADDGAWDSWTPTWSQGGALVGSINYARYRRIGRTIHCSFHITSTAGSPVAGNAVIINGASLPATPEFSQAQILVVGAGYGQLSGVQYALNIVLLGTGSAGSGHIRFLRNDAPINNYWGIDPAVVTGAGDSVSGTFTYEAAS